MAESFISFPSIYGDAHGPSMSYHEDADWATRCDELGEVIAGLRGIGPNRVEPSTEVLDEWEEADHVRQLIRVGVSEFSARVAYLLIPIGLREGETRPGILASHGHTANGPDMTCGAVGMDYEVAAKRSYGLEALRSGYVVTAPACGGGVNATATSIVSGNVTDAT